MLNGIPMTPAPTIVLMKLKDALATELSPLPSLARVASDPTVFSEKVKGDSSVCPVESDIMVSSCSEVSSLLLCDGMNWR